MHSIPHTLEVEVRSTGWPGVALWMRPPFLVWYDKYQ
jgi:hypothetical protein